MFRSALIVVTIALLMPQVWASHLLSASSKLMLARGQAPGQLNTPLTQSSLYPAFISVNDSSAIRRLHQAGVDVNVIFDGFISAQVPINVLDDIAAIDGVTLISLSRHLALCNDSARYLSRVDELHQGYDLIAGIRGSGVIVGLIDTGIDFNHINLCDANGRSRVRAVYLPCDSSGSAPVIDGMALPGSCYESPDAIAALTTDCTVDSHGTHTAGTAAGSYFPNGLHGVAPDADIVVCGMPENELTDVNIANGVKYIFDYATRHHMPCVINMSIGSNEGPNDGTSLLCRAFASMSGPGRICVLSAGNDGNAPICFHSSLAGIGDTVTTFLRNQMGGLQRDGFVSMWSDQNQIHKSRVVIINRSTGALEYASPFIGNLPDDSVYCLSSETDPEFALYYTGEMMFAGALEPSSTALPPSSHQEPYRYHSYWVFDVKSLVAGHLLGIQYAADTAVELTGWCTKKAYFYTFGFDYATGGTTSGSISDLATCDSVVSVGAYCSRHGYVDSSGQYQSFNNSLPGEIADFSSYGPDERGVSRPDLCAPGLAVISSANRYDEKSDRSIWPHGVLIDGQSYPYYANQGTSMSAPMVAGTIALMLQINPTLSPSAIRGILRQTAFKDSMVMNGDAQKWGSGKLDARAAVNRVIERTLLPGDVNNDHEVTIADVGALIDILLGNMPDHDALAKLRADVNRDKEIQISDINQLIELLLK